MRKVTVGKKYAYSKLSIMNVRTDGLDKNIYLE